MTAHEVNFDGLVGLTHHYAGLSFGNEASTRHRFQVSNPRLAVKQGLLKMKALLAFQREFRVANVGCECGDGLPIGRRAGRESSPDGGEFKQ